MKTIDPIEDQLVDETDGELYQCYLQSRACKYVPYFAWRKFAMVMVRTPLQNARFRGTIVVEREDKNERTE